MYPRFIGIGDTLMDLIRYFDGVIQYGTQVYTSLEKGLVITNGESTITLKGDGLMDFEINGVTTSIDSHSYNFFEKFNKLLREGGWK